MEILKVKNYRVFAENLKKKTDCDIKIQVLEKDHFHFQLSKDGISIGVLCIDNGEASFAPFVTLEKASRSDQYINVQYMPMLADFIKVLNVFSELFVCEEEEN